MEKIWPFLRAAALALPLTIASADAAAETTKSKTRAAVSRVTEITDEELRGLRRHVHGALVQEKCFILAKAPKNAVSWLEKTARMIDLNDQAGTRFDSETNSEFERLKNELEKEREKAGTSYTVIQDVRRYRSKGELECLTSAPKMT